MSIKEASIVAGIVGGAGGAGAAYHFGLGGSSARASDGPISLSLQCSESLFGELGKLTSGQSKSNLDKDWTDVETVIPKNSCWAMNVTSGSDKSGSEFALVSTNDSKGVVVYSKLSTVTENSKTSVVLSSVVAYVDKKTGKEQNGTWEVTRGFEFTNKEETWFKSDATGDVTIKFGDEAVNGKFVYKWTPKDTGGNEIDLFKLKFSMGSVSDVKPLLLGQDWDKSKATINKVYMGVDKGWQNATGKTVEVNKKPLQKDTTKTPNGEWKKIFPTST